jgi:hypothetical protein
VVVVRAVQVERVVDEVVVVAAEIRRRSLI